MSDETQNPEDQAGEDPTPEDQTGEESSANDDAARPNRRKVREGLVVSTKMDKTVVVAVVDRVRHRRYQKTMQRTRKFYAHDEANEIREGDRVRIAEIRPMSRQKRWRVVEVLERAR